MKVARNLVPTLNLAKSAPILLGKQVLGHESGAKPCADLESRNQHRFCLENRFWDMKVAQNRVPGLNLAKSAPILLGKQVLGHESGAKPCADLESREISNKTPTTVVFEWLNNLCIVLWIRCVY